MGGDGDGPVQGKGQWQCQERAPRRGVGRINTCVKNNEIQVSHCCIRELETRKGGRENERCDVRLLLEVPV